GARTSRHHRARAHRPARHREARLHPPRHGGDEPWQGGKPAREPGAAGPHAELRRRDGGWHRIIARAAARHQRTARAAPQARRDRRTRGGTRRIAAMTLQGVLEQFGGATVFVNTLIHEIGLPAPLTPTVLVASVAIAGLRPQTVRRTAAVVA